MRNVDFAVVGGGVIGVRVAIELKRRHPDCSVALLEKERSLGQHASGRNSGVLHAGFYYTADSLKARFTKQGNAEMRAYCEEYGLRILRCGKLVVARDEGDLTGLDELERRARANGVELHRVSSDEAAQIEPRAKTFERALWSPTTATVDPGEVMRAFGDEARGLGVEVLTGVRHLGRAGAGIRTSAGAMDAGYTINCAGLYADAVARDFGFGEGYRILPFKGLYLYSSEPSGAFRTNLYPVPDLRNPFLGVHFTVTVDGRAKIGPTALPCYWRENYAGVGRFRAREFASVLGTEARLMLRAGFDFRGIALSETRKRFRRTLVSQAGRLATNVRLSDYTHWGHPGIRAQLLDVRHRTLVMDFLVQGDERSLHVLNAVSPAFTCSIPFARHVVEMAERSQS